MVESPGVLAVFIRVDAESAESVQGRVMIHTGRISLSSHKTQTRGETQEVGPTPGFRTDLVDSDSVMQGMQVLCSVSASSIFEDWRP